ncbi:MAG TPA: TolC family protein, partial [Holophagaceae bacterium]
HQGFDLLLSDAAVQSAQADLQTSRTLPAPVLGLSAGWTSGYDAAAAGPGASDRAYAASLSDSNALSDLLWGKRRLRTRVAQAALEAARLGRQDAERTLLGLLRQQYLQTALAGRARSVAEEVAQSARKTLDLVEVRCQAGAVSEADVARARVAWLEARQGVDAAAQAERSNQAGLAFLLGYRDAPPVFLLDRRFEDPDVSAPPAGSTADLLEAARAHRPDLQAALAQERRAQASLQLARRDWAPDLTWTVGVSQEGTGQNALQPRTYTLGVAVPLPSPRHIRGEIAKAEVDLRTQILQRGKLEAQVALDVANANAALQASRSRLERMRQDLLPSARQAFHLVAFQYEKGATSLLDVLDAQRTLMATQAEFLQDLNDYWTARFQLDQALGKDSLR